MSNSETLVNFEGAITFGTIEMLLNRLRCNALFSELPKPARKRLYGIFVESIDNIFKYAVKGERGKKRPYPHPRISVVKSGEKFVVKSGNMVRNEDVGDLIFKMERVNQLDEEALKTLYEQVINKESSLSDTGAGLGLITMAMRTDHDIIFRFSEIDSLFSFFEYEIILKG